MPRKNERTVEPWRKQHKKAVCVCIMYIYRKTRWRKHVRNIYILSHSSLRAVSLYNNTHSFVQSLLLLGCCLSTTATTTSYSEWREDVIILYVATNWQFIKGGGMSARKGELYEMKGKMKKESSPCHLFLYRRI